LSSPPDDVTRTAVLAHEERTSGEIAFALSVVTGANAGQRVPLEASRPSALLVGQSPVCDFRLEDPMVSRRHASFEIVGERVRVRDLGSTNGTRVNGIAVVEAFLVGGESVAIGESELQLSRVAGEAAPSVRPTRDGFGGVVGKSPAMRRLYPLLERLAASDVPIVIEGETGTGKEVVAEAIHAHSARRDKPYVVFDCTAVAPTLVEAELFGHERGAYTGAVGARKGVFELADGGTLLIDEIGDLELHLQPKLLRVLERGEIRRVGGQKPIQIDVRVLAATRRNLDEAVQLGRFRDDLFHRLAVARVELPPLRRRDGDVAELARHLWRELGGKGSVPAELLARWVIADFPGNVRELKNAVARHIALGDLSLEPEGTPPSKSQDFLFQTIAEQLPLPVARAKVVAELERRYIEHSLEQHAGDVTAAARASGVARRYFQLLRSGKRRQ
jgi:two-component system, NtrC family, response regulator HydG